MDVDEVVVTDKAKEKAFRMFNEGELKQKVKNKNARETHGDNRYKIQAKYEDKKGQFHEIDIIVVKEQEDGKMKGIVVTQKHTEHGGIEEWMKKQK